MLASLVVLAAPTGSGNAGLVLFLQMGAIVAIFYFLLIRPQRQQQKKHRAMLDALKKGDEVMTDGGILGEVIHIKEDRITIKTAENTRLLVARAKIARVFLPTESSETVEK